jgi:hypothetical protein
MTSDTLAMIQAYLDGGSGSTMEQIIMKQAYGDIVRLTAERDDALKEIDNLQDVCGDAADRMVALCKERDRALAERDEARREVCMWQSISPQHDTNGIFDIADQRGWDCYKKQNEALDRIAQFDQENGLL